MNDAYLYFTADTGDALTDSSTLSKVLLEDEITDLGKGTKLMIEVWSDGGFTSGAEVVSLHLKTGTTSPGDTKLMEIVSDKSVADLSVAGLVQRVSLPEVGISDYISMYYYAETSVTAGGKLLVKLAPEFAP